MLRYYFKHNAFWCQGKKGECGHPMIKDRACNHMTCPKCLEVSCWGCGQLWDLATAKVVDEYGYWQANPKGTPNKRGYSVHYKGHISNPPRRDYCGDEAWPDFPWPARKFY